MRSTPSPSASGAPCCSWPMPLSWSTPCFGWQVWSSCATESGPAGGLAMPRGSSGKASGGSAHGTGAAEDAALISRASLLPVVLDFLGFLVVEARRRGAGLAVHMKELVELRVHRLGVTMLGALDEQRHHPRRERRKSVPIESLGLEYRPQDSVKHDDQEGRGMGGQDAEAREKVSRLTSHGGATRRSKLCSGPSLLISRAQTGSPSRDRRSSRKRFPNHRLA